MSFVYILKCSDGTFYTGATRDLEKRVHAHQKGRGAKYTRGRLPVRLYYSEACTDLSVAFKREREIKKLSRAKKLILIKDTRTKRLKCN